MIVIACAALKLNCGVLGAQWDTWGDGPEGYIREGGVKIRDRDIEVGWGSTFEEINHYTSVKVVVRALEPRTI